MDYNLKKYLEKKGVKFKYPPKPGYVVPLTDDRMFRIFCRDKNNRKFVAKLINLVTGIDYDLLIERMIVIDSTISDDSVSNHLNDQDVVVTINNTTLNLEMSTNLYNNKRKNERTAFKYAGNQYNPFYRSYLLENYKTIFDNSDLSIEFESRYVIAVLLSCYTKDLVKDKRYDIDMYKFLNENINYLYPEEFYSMLDLDVVDEYTLDLSEDSYKKLKKSYCKYMR